MFIPMALALLAAAPTPGPTRNSADDAAQIVARAQALYDALAPGDVALWRDALTDDAVIIDEFGRRQSKSEVLADLRPMPKGFSGSIEVRTPHVRFYPPVAVLDCEAYERERVFDQQLVTRYLSTFVFVRAGKSWRVASLQEVTLPTEPPKLEVRELTLSDYPGTYSYGPGRAYLVESNGGALAYRRRKDGPATALEPLAKDVFMEGGDERNLVLFRRDERGRVTSLIERRKFNDLTMRRLEGGR